MREPQLIVIVILIMFSCSKRQVYIDNNLQYIFLKRSGYIDTLHRNVKYHLKSDSTYSITYLTKRNNDQYEEIFTFPTSKNDILNFTRLIDQKTIKFEEQEYIVYKYLMDYPNGEDDGMLYFYSPKYGILVSEAVSWGNYDKLTDFGNPKDNKVIFFLTEMITNDDKNFFTNSK